MFIGGMWFQDLFNDELPNLQTSTAVVVDSGLDPTRRVSADVAFSFKNAGYQDHQLTPGPILVRWPGNGHR
jgi:hypothetical protein